MIRHIVLYQFRDDIPKEKIAAIFKKLSKLKGLVSGVNDLRWGENLPSNSKNAGFSYGITVDLVDESVFKVYSPHPLHQEVRAEMTPLLIDSPLMFDFNLI